VILPLDPADVEATVRVGSPASSVAEAVAE
jgi:hypothetical protein